MGTTREEIQAWLEEGKRKGARWMVVVTDTWDYEDGPTYVMPGEDVNKVIAENSNPNAFSKVMEVYSYALNLDVQLNERRAWHLE